MQLGMIGLGRMGSGMVRPRAIWLMLPAAVEDQTLTQLVPLLSLDDIVIDGGKPPE
jgi:6-phosphogluconate dehydrogenase